MGCRARGDPDVVVALASLRVVDRPRSIGGGVRGDPGLPSPPRQARIPAARRRFPAATMMVPGGASETLNARL